MEKNKLDFFDKAAFWVLILFVIFVPFHAFLVTFLWKFLPEFVNYFSVWKEVLFLILWFLFFWKFVKNYLENSEKEDWIANRIKDNLVNKFFSTWKNFSENKNFFQKFFSKTKKFFWLSKKSFPIQKFYLFDILFWIFFLIAVLPVFFKFFFPEFFWVNLWDNFLVQSILGFRLDFIYFIFFYFTRWFNFSFSGNFSQIKKLFYVFVLSWLASLIFWFSLYSQSFNWVPEKIITSKDNFQELSFEKKQFLDKFYYSEKPWFDTLLLKWDLNSEQKNELKKFFENSEQINFRNENFLNLMYDFGYSAWVSNYEVDKSLPAFHIVEAKWTARFASTFAGPNQLGFYLMVFIGLILGFLKYAFTDPEVSDKNILWKISFKNRFKFMTPGSLGAVFLIWTLIFALICLYFSFSRSAWLWTILIFSLFIFFSFPEKYRWKIFFWWLISWILLILYTYFFQSDFFERTILRWGSTSMHIEKTLEWIEIIKENPMWLWLWMAWPVTMRFSELWEEKIAENWFVQMFQEFWVLWWIIYLLFIWSFLVFLIKNFLKNNFENFSWFLLFWGFLWLSWILFAGLFLHSFEDIWVSLLLFMLIWIWFISWKNCYK